jgi:hypothetical protein
LLRIITVREPFISRKRRNPTEAAMSVDETELTSMVVDHELKGARAVIIPIAGKEWFLTRSLQIFL